MQELEKRISELEGQLAESQRLNQEKDAQIQLLRSELARNRSNSVEPTLIKQQSTRSTSLNKQRQIVRSHQGHEFSMDYKGRATDGSPDGWGRGECSDGCIYTGWWKQNGGSSYILGICQVEFPDGSKFFGYLGNEQSPGSGSETQLFSLWMGEYTTQLYTHTGSFRANQLAGPIPEELRYKDSTKRGWQKAFQDYKKQAEEWEKQAKK